MLFFDRRDFAIRLTFALVFLVAFTIGFPFITYAIAKASHCENVGGACGAVALMAGIFLKPIGYVIFVVCLGLAVAGRLRWLPGFAAILLAVTLLADLPFAVAFGAHWSVAFSLGIMGPVVPWRILTVLLTAGALIAVDESNPRLRERWVMIVVVTALVMLSWKLIFMVPGGMHALRRAGRTVMRAYANLERYGGPSAFVALLATYAYVLFGARFGGGGPPIAAPPRPKPPLGGLPQTRSTFGQKS